MSGVYGKTDDAQSVAVIHAAMERGVKLIDTPQFPAIYLDEAKKGGARIAGVKRDARLRVRMMRRQLVYKLAEDFRTINQRTADQLIGLAKQAASEKTAARLELVEITERWRLADSDLGRLIAIGSEIDPGAAA